MATLWVLHQLQTAPALTLGPFTARSFRGSLVPITLYGVQVRPSCKRTQTGASKRGACLLASRSLPQPVCAEVISKGVTSELSLDPGRPLLLALPVAQ